MHKQVNELLVSSNVRMYCIVYLKDVSLFCNKGSVICIVVYTRNCARCSIKYTISSIIGTIRSGIWNKGSIIGTVIMKMIEK